MANIEFIGLTPEEAAALTAYLLKLRRKKERKNELPKWKGIPEADPDPPPTDPDGNPPK